MSVTYQSFENLKTILDQAKSNKYNLMLISLPGTGLSHYLKQYQEANPIDTSYISDISSPSLSHLNLIDTSFLASPEAYIDIDKLWLSAKVDQKFAIVIDDPGWLRTPHAQKCQFLDRVYRTEFFPVHSPDDIQLLSVDKNPNITPDHLQEVISQSAGLARLVKYISLKDSFSPSWWNTDTQLQRLIQPTLLAISHSSDEDLNSLGLKKNGQFQSQLISDLVNKISSTNFDINISPDLVIIENGQNFGKKSSPVEKALLAEMQANNGIISKEKIAEIKWGQDSYDSFSDQAIKKTMMRLSVKLRKYRIKSITKFGYQLSLR